MKKIDCSLWILITLLSAAGLSAQEVRYQGEFDVAYGIGFGTEYRNVNRVLFETVHGVRVGSCFSVGIGTGLHYYLSTEVKTLRGQKIQIGEAEVIPVFLNVKGYFLPSKKVAPFMSMDLGYGIMAHQSMKEGISLGYLVDKRDGGFFLAPAFGLTFDRRASISLGYECQFFKFGKEAVAYDAIQFRVGVFF